MSSDGLHSWPKGCVLYFANVEILFWRVALGWLARFSSCVRNFQGWLDVIWQAVTLLAFSRVSCYIYQKPQNLDFSDDERIFGLGSQIYKIIGF